MTPTYRSNRLVKISVIFIIIAICLYWILNAYNISQNTGILGIDAPAGANLTVYKAGFELKTFGTGPTTVRLSPGNYQIIVTKNDSQVIKRVTITKKITTKLTVTLTATPTPGHKNESANNLIKLLPIVGPAESYEINYTYQYTSTVANPIIIITASTPAGQQQALQWIRSKGFSTSTLTINYVQQAVQTNNYTNGLP